MGGNISAEQLMLYFNLLLTVIVVLGALGGFFKGFKKSLFRFIKEIIFVAGFFFTADLVAGFILNSEIVFDLVVQYVPVNGMPSNMIELVQCIMVDYLGVSPDATLTSSIHFLFAIASIAFKLVYAVIYFIIIKLLYNIICAILYRVLFNRKHTETFFKLKKRKNGKTKKIKEKVDLRKGAQGPRLLGALFGAGKSMITVTMVVSLIMSIVSLLPKGLGNYLDGDSNVTASNKTTLSAENKNDLSQALDGLEEYIKFIDDLENSPYVKLVRTIESDGETLDLVLFDTVMNGQYEEYNIRTRESLSLIVNIGFDVYTIISEASDEEGNIDLNNVDVEHLAELIEKVTEIDLLMETIPVVLEIGLSLDSLEEQLPITIDDEMRESISQIDWKNDVKVIADVVRTLGDVEDLNAVFYEPSALLSKNNEKIITDVIKSLSDLTIFTKTLPALVEFAMNSDEVQNMIGDATIDLSNIVWEEELVQVAEIYSVFQTLTQDITTLLFADEINPGDIIDGINLNALNRLVEEIFKLGLMEELFEPIMDLVVANIEDEAIREMLNFDIDNYEDWAKEFSIIIDIVKELLAGGNPFENGIDVSIVNYINPNTIAKSKILSQVIVSALVDAANGEGIFVGEGASELSEFIDVPTYLKDKDSPLWFNVYDENGDLVSKGQLHKTLVALQSILPDDKETRININETLQLGLVFGGVEHADVVFASSNPSVATVDQSGLVEGKTPGHAVIIASTSYGKVKDMIDIVVKSEEAVSVEYVLIEGEIAHNIVIGLGKENREFLSANTNLDATNQIIDWESLDETIVKVSDDGAIEGIQVGQTIVRAVSNADPSKFAICTVTVVETMPKEIVVNKENIVGHVGKVVYLDASINGSKEGLTYEVNNGTVAKVDEEGFVNLLGIGETTLTVYNANKTISKVVNILVVDDSMPTSIKIATSLEGGLDVSSVLSSISEKDIENIVESDVLTRSLSKILLNALGSIESETPVHIPNSVMENDAGTQYISKQEIQKILNIVVEVDITSLLEGGDVTQLLGSLTDENVDAILESKVLSAFLSSTLSSVGEGMIVVPSSAYQDVAPDFCYEHPSQEVKYIKNSEIKALIKMVKDYDLLSGGEIAIPLSADNSELISLLEESSILRATLSKFIIDMAQSDGAVIVVPDQAIETVDDCKILKIDEFEAALNALYDLGINEISQNISLDLKVGDLNNAKDSINESLVLRATVTDFIIPVEQIVVPDQALDASSYTANGSKIKLLKKTELASLVDALTTLLGEDTTFDSISLDLNVGDIKSALPKIEASTVLKATVSDIVIDIEEVVVPDQATDNDNYTVENNKIRVIIDNELDSLVKTLASLLGEDTTIDNIELDVTVGDLKNSLTDIKQSKILMATISSFVDDVEEVVVPDQAFEVGYTLNSSAIDVVKTEELDHLVNTLVELLGADATFDTITLDLTVGDLENSLDDITQSKILMATISKFINEANEIIVPDQALDTGYTVDEVVIDVLKDTELEGLVNTLVTLLGEDATVDTISLDLTISELQGALVDIKQSTVIMATLSDIIVDVEMIVVPDQAMENDYYTVDDVYIPMLLDDELDSLVNTLADLMDPNEKVDHIELELSVGTLRDSLTNIKKSSILMATISDMVVPLEEVVVPDQATDNETYSVNNTKIRVLKKTELDSLVNALVVLLGENASVDNIQLDLTIGELQDAIDDIKPSTIIMATLTDAVIDLEEIIVPDQAFTDEDYSVDNAPISVLKGSELEGLVDTLANLMDENEKIDHIELELSIGSVQDSLSGINSSSILMATVSDMIVPLENIVVPDQALDSGYTVDEVAIDVLKTTELNNLVNTIAELLGRHASVDNIQLDLTISELQGSLDEIQTSLVMMATISDVIVDLEEIIVPDQAFTDEDYSVESSPISVLKGSELEGLVDTLANLMDPNEKVDHIELSLSIGSIQDSLSEINSSSILMATISDMIVPLENIVVPDQALDSGYTVNTVAIDVLKTTELNNLVNTIAELLGRHASVDNIELDLTISELQDSLDEIQTSLVLMATISDAIVDLDAIVVPDQAIDKVSYQVKSAPIPVLLNAELEYLIDTLAVLVDPSQKVNNIELDISTGSLKNSLPNIVLSKILMATISDIVVPLESIIVPDQVLDSGYTVNDADIDVLTTDELEALTDALFILLGPSASLMHIELDLTVSQLNGAVSSINASGILRVTVGDMIVPLDSIIIPDEVVINNLFSKGLTYYPVLKEDELVALFASLNALTGSSKVDSLNLDLTVGKLSYSIDTFNTSSILRATITDKLSSVSALIKPDQAFEEDGTFNKDGSSIAVMKGIELKAFTSALSLLLGAETPLNNSLSLNVSVGKLKLAVEPINQSAVLKATIGDKIINNANLIVPDQIVDSTSYSVDSINVKVLEDEELEHLIAALESLLGTSATIEGISLNFKVGTLKAKIVDINNSIIIRSTISDKISGVSALSIINEAYEVSGTFTQNSTSINVLTTGELKGIIDSLAALLGENTEITGSLELSLTVSDLYDSVDDINTSLVLRTTITDKIKVSLDIPDDALDITIYHKGSSEARILSTNELKTLAKALVNILGNGQSLESFNIPTNLVSILLAPSDEANKNKLEQSLESLIIWDKISNMIDDVTGSLIKVPDDARVDGIHENRITVAEINSLFEALDVLGISDINDISLSANFILLLDDETKDALGNTELTRTTIALEKSKILMASIPSLFESGIRGAYEEPITLDFSTVTLEGVLNAEGTAYVTEGELVRLFRAVRAANTLKNKTLTDITGKISDPNSSVSYINKQFLAINASEVLKPTVAQVLASLVDRDELLGNTFEDSEITLILSQTAAVQDINAYASENKTGDVLVDNQITAIQLTATTNILSATTHYEVEAIYDAAVNAIDSL